MVDAKCKPADMRREDGYISEQSWPIRPATLDNMTRYGYRTRDGAWHELLTTPPPGPGRAIITKKWGNMTDLRDFFRRRRRADPDREPDRYPAGSWTRGRSTRSRTCCRSKTSCERTRGARAKRVRKKTQTNAVVSVTRPTSRGRPRSMRTRRSPCSRWST